MRSFSMEEKLAFIRAARRMSESSWQIAHSSRDEIQKIRDQRFLNILRYAYRHIPFYQRLYDELAIDVELISGVSDITELPIVTKADLLAGYPNAVLSNHYKDPSQNLMLVTGGTSGVSLKIHHSMSSIYASLISYERAYSSMLGRRYSPRDRVSYVYTSNYPFASFGGGFPQQFIWTLDDPELILRKLEYGRPNLLSTYPSVLDAITHTATPQQITDIGNHLLAISVNSEMSSQVQRSVYESIWRVPVLDEFCSEEISTVIFHQCREHAYHVNDDNCVIECVDSHGKSSPVGVEGDLVVTSLWNYAMPLIRYDQGDRIVLSDESKHCRCGLSFRLLETLQGRNNDSFLLPNGRIIPSGVLLDIGYSVLSNFGDDLKFWQMVQEEDMSVHLDCVFSEDIPSERRSEIEEKISNASPDLAIRIRMLDVVPTSNGGKRRQVVSKVLKTTEGGHLLLRPLNIPHYAAYAT